MSKIQDLKNDPTNNINVVELLKNLFPELKTKYLELLLRLIKDNIKNSHYYNDLINGHFELSKRIKFDEYEPYEAIFLTFVINEFMRMDDIDTFLKFAEYNEKNQIENGDVTAIKNMDFINNEVSKVEIRTISKDMAKQIVKLHEDDTWLVIKPLTVMASRKYGSNTKWCTTANSDYSYFHQYASNGILIYILNKKTGYKLALHKHLKKTNANLTVAPSGGELTFWNQQDQRIDSMEADLPREIFLILAADVKECKIPNRKMLSEEERIKEAKLFPENKNSGLIDAQEIMPRNAIRVRDAEEDMVLDGTQEPDIERNNEPEGEVAWSGPYIDRSDEEEFDGNDENLPHWTTSENLNGEAEMMDFREELQNQRIMEKVPYIPSKTVSNDERPQDEGTNSSL